MKYKDPVGGQTYIRIDIIPEDGVSRCRGCLGQHNLIMCLAMPDCVTHGKPDQYHIWQPEVRKA